MLYEEIYFSANKPGIKFYFEIIPSLQNSYKTSTKHSSLRFTNLIHFATFVL